MKERDTPQESFSAPEPPEDWFIAQGWTRGDGIWWKPNGEPVFLVDLYDRYPPLRAWIDARTKCCQDGSCTKGPQHQVSRLERSEGQS
jgi:hypothetical protein